MSYKSSEEASYTQTQQYRELTAAAGETICVTLVILIVLGLGSGLPIGLIKVPPHTKFTITEASIMQLNLTNVDTLYYNFKVTITVKNFHHNMIYHKATAVASYKGNQLTLVNMAPFILNRKNIVRLEPIVFEGNSVMTFDPQQLEYNKETQLGIYNLDLDIHVHTYLAETHLHCPNLRVPLIFNGKVAPTNFNVTKCHKDTTIEE